MSREGGRPNQPSLKNADLDGGPSQKELVRAEIIAQDIMARSIYKNGSTHPLGQTWMGFQSKTSLGGVNQRSEPYLHALHG